MRRLRIHLPECDPQCCLIPDRLLPWSAACACRPSSSVSLVGGEATIPGSAPFQQPPGWYADPRARDVLRWWDGSRWTGQTRRVPSGTAAPSETRTASSQTRMVIRTPGAPPDWRQPGGYSRSPDDRDHHRYHGNGGDRRDDYGAGSRHAPARHREPVRTPLNRRSAPDAPTRAEQRLPTRVSSSGDEAEEDQWEDARVKFALSGLFGISILMLAFGYALNADGLRLVALTCALFFGAGTAPLQLSDRVPLDVRLGVAGLVGLAVPLFWGSVMVLTPLWHPLVFAILIGAVAIYVHVVACRRVLAGPLRDGIFSSGERIGSHVDISITLTAAGTVLWLTAMFITGHVVPGVLGFLPKVPVFWYLGLLLVLAGIVLSHDKGESRAVLSVTSLLAALTVTPAALYGMPRSQSAAKHIDLVMNILQAHHLNRGSGIYQAYSGFFSGVAWLCDLSGVHNVTAIATYWPFFIDLLVLAALRFFFGRMVSSWYRIWVAITVVVLVNSIGADYFSPQSAGFALGIGVFALAFATETDGLERSRIVLLALAGCAMAVTHEFSPYLVGGTLVVLVAFRITRPWYVAPTILVPAILWAALNKGVLSGFISLSDLFKLSNFAPPKTVSTPGLSRLAIVRASSDALALGLLVLVAIAAIGLLRNRRSRPTWAFLAATGVGLALIAANPYGNEGIFRAALFAIPWLAAAGLNVLRANPSPRTMRVYGLVAAGLMATYLVSMFGLDNENVIRPDDYQALLFYQSTAAPTSYLMQITNGDLPVSVDFPQGYGHTVRWSDLLNPAQVKTLSPTKADAASLALLYYDHALKNDGETSDLYAIWSPAAAAYNVDYGLETLAQAETWRNLLIASPDWKVVYSGGGTYLFRVSFTGGA